MTARNESSADRPLALSMRRDLEVRPLRFTGQRYWNVKDPIALRYFQLRDEEHFILQSLDGRASAAQIRDRFERRFAPRKLALSQLHGFLGLLHQQGLVVSGGAGQGATLLRRRGRQRRRAMAAACGNLLALRFPGLDPHGLLDGLHARCRWLFTWPALAAWAVLVCSAVLLVAMQFGVLRARLPEWGTFFGPQNIIWIAAALAATKVLHELGHALACRHFGAECHEIGLMFLVFTPCLYCNVTDAWMLPNKWHRAAIGAAGMWAELGVASLCTFLWWFTEPGLLNALCLNTMFVCSVGTLLFNGNSLLRFDGYFILSDLLEVPNLQPRSAAVLASHLRRRWLGLPEGAEPVSPGRPGLLALYGVASTGYRWFLVLGILWLFHGVLEAQRLEVVAVLLAILVVAGLLAVPAWRAAKFLRDPGVRRQLRWAAAARATALLAAAAAAFALLPLPHRITAPAMLVPRDARRVYVAVPGILLDAVRPGDVVRAGQTLAHLENADLHQEIARLTGLRDLQQLRVANLRGRRVVDPSAGEQIPVAEEALADLEEQLRQRQLDAQRLTISAPQAGAVLPPPAIRREARPGELAPWSHSPLDASNHGAYLETGAMLCMVGDPQRLEALAVIDQAEVEFVRTGQRVRIRLEQLPGKTLRGRVAELSELDLETVPGELLSTGLVPTRQDASGHLRPAHACYLARVALDASGEPLLLGSPGRAKIHAPPRSLAARLHRCLRGTLRFPW